MPDSPRVLDILRADTATAPWLAYLESLGPVTVAYEIPPPAELANRLTWCEVPPAALPTIIEVATQVRNDGDLAWLLDRAVQQLWQDMDRVNWPQHIPRLPDALGETNRWFYAVVFASFLPLTLDASPARHPA